MYTVLATKLSIYKAQAWRCSYSSFPFSEGTSAADLPNGLTPRRTISDFMRKLSGLVLTVLRDDLGHHIIMKDIQWCITVPALWDEQAKQEMKICAEIAGLAQGANCKDKSASPHPVIIVLEPEAASFYCQEKSNFPLNNGDRFLVVDAGGLTVDLAVHEKVGPPWSRNVREVAPSSGGLCGATYVDKGFFRFLSKKISCFRNFVEKQPQTILKLLSWWGRVKRNFDGNMPFDYELELPAKLARAWEKDHTLNDVRSNAVTSYDSLALSLEDMLSIFDPVVDQVLHLIDKRMTPNLKAMMVVGGFSNSSYLKKRIKDVFSERLAPGTLIFPKEPGSAICCGAVAFGVDGPDIVMSRISKKTYGIMARREFRQGDPIHLISRSGDRVMCDKTFVVFTRKGDILPVDFCVSHTVNPNSEDSIRTRISMLSTSDTDPGYIMDPGVTLEGSFLVHHPSRKALGKKPEIRVSMFFGQAMVEVKAVGENFGEGEHIMMPPVTFERSFERPSELQIESRMKRRLCCLH